MATLSTMGALLPRDFLERQPKRWQKSQRKRRVLGTLRKMKAKHEKVMQRTIDQAQRDAGIDAPRREKPSKPQAIPELPSKPQTAPAEPVARPPPPSHCVPFGPHGSGLWAAELTPYQPLVVRIPEGLQLSVLRASLSAGSAGAADAAPSFVRCRTPSTKVPVTLCVLQPQCEETCNLSALFSHADQSCALAVEGAATVHLIGCYQRSAAAGAVGGDSSAARRSEPASREGSTNGVASAKSAAAQRGSQPSTGTPTVQGPPPRPTTHAAALAAPSAAAPAPSAASSAAPAAPILVELAEGLKYTDTKVGGGRRAARGNKMSVKYVGLAPDPKAPGSWKEFDRNGGKTLHFTLGDGEMIRAWDVGLVGMRQGGTRRLVVPPAMGYGEAGAGPIPPRATLIFEVHLVNVV
jgi:FKBP-type peptidyl-prolyl cis-trans isomerase